MTREPPRLPALALAAAPAPAQALHDVRGPVDIVTEPPFLVSGGLLLLLLAGLLLWRRETRARPSAPTTGHAHVRAQLERLAADYRRGACSGAELIPRLDTLLRGALAEATGCPASTLTTPELLAALSGVAHPDTIALAPLLSLLDRLKFAGPCPTPEEAAQALARVTAYLEASWAAGTP